LIADARDGKTAERLSLSSRRYRMLRGPVYSRAIGLKLFRAYIATDLNAFEQRFRAHAERLAGLR
jgi:hypothetical protein